MADYISLEGPVEVYEGQLAIRIPLDCGGSELAPFARGIAEADDEYLTVIVKPWLAEKLRIGQGSLVIVDNRDGKFNVTRSAANDASA